MAASPRMSIPTSLNPSQGSHSLLNSSHMQNPLNMSQVTGNRSGMIGTGARIKQQKNEACAGKRDKSSAL